MKVMNTPPPLQGFGIIKRKIKKQNLNKTDGCSPCNKNGCTFYSLYNV